MSVNKKFNGAFSMGSSLRLQGREEQKRKGEPGPGHFESTFYDKPTSMRTVFGSSQKGMKLPKPQAPPCNTYNIKTTIGSGLKFSFRGHNSKENKQNTIRTENYTPQQAEKQKPPQYSMGYKEQENDTFKVKNGDCLGPGFYHKEPQDIQKEKEAKQVTRQQHQAFYHDYNHNNSHYPWERQHHSSQQLKRYTTQGFMSSSNIKRHQQTGLGIGPKQPNCSVKSTTPGPGTYHLQALHSSRHFRIGEKVEPPSSHIHPGPGHYHPSNQQQKGKQFSLTGKAKHSLHIDMNIPGSQKYHPSYPISQLHMQFGQGHRSKVTLGKFQASVPGPGTYFRSLSDEEGEQSRTPTHHPQSLHNSKGFSFGYAVRDKAKEEMEEEKGYSSVKKLVQTSSDFPGPGQYEVVKKTEKNDARKFMLRGRGEKPSKAYRVVFPGPGKYDNTKQVQKNVKQGMMGKSSRFGQVDKKKQNNPGPGSYKVRKELDGRQSSFGKINNKSEVYRYPEPGPGSYQVQSTIAQIPKYLVQKKDNHFDDIKDIVGF